LKRPLRPRLSGFVFFFPSWSEPLSQLCRLRFTFASKTFCLFFPGLATGSPLFSSAFFQTSLFSLFPNLSVVGSREVSRHGATPPPPPPPPPIVRFPPFRRPFLRSHLCGLMFFFFFLLADPGDLRFFDPMWAARQSPRPLRQVMTCLSFRSTQFRHR